MNARAACFSFEDPLKFLKLLRVFLVTLWSISILEYFYIQGCCKASFALIRSFGLNASSLFTRSIASGEISYHSSSSVRNYPYFTFFIIYSSLAPLKGG